MSDANGEAGGKAQAGGGAAAGAGDELETPVGAPTGAQLEPQLEAQLGPWPWAAGEARPAPAEGAGAEAKAATPAGARGEIGVATEKLPFGLEYLGAGGARRRVAPGRLLGVGEGAYFAVRGALPDRLPLVYVLQVENSEPPHVVRVGLFAVVRELGGPGDEVRLPQEGTFLFNRVRGQVVVLAAERLLTQRELDELCGGREPPPDPLKGGST
jgi:hypothetical protein